MDYLITPQVNSSVGYYYQNGDLGTADGSGVLGRLAYDISNGLTAGVNISYDEAFDTRVSADIKVLFGGASTTAQRKDVPFGCVEYRIQCTRCPICT